MFKLADEAICIGGPKSVDSYMRADRIHQRAEIADVDAIHPGYGFSFREQQSSPSNASHANIRFIGPTVHTIKIMGD